MEAHVERAAMILFLMSALWVAAWIWTNFTLDGRIDACLDNGGAVPHDGRELLGQGLVHLVEDRPDLREGFGKGLAHPDRLTSLPGEDECALHGEPPLIVENRARTRTRTPTSQGEERVPSHLDCS